MKRLGGSTLRDDPTAISANMDGESVCDTIKMMSNSCDAIVIRHPSPQSAQEAANASALPVLNGGNGAGEHPTQALLDIYTINCFYPSLLDETCTEPLRITFVGDLKNGRTVHSLVLLLARYNTEFTYVAPEELQMPNVFKERVEKTFETYGIANISSRQKRENSLSVALKKSDIVYVTRLQKERFESEASYKALKDSGLLDLYNLTNEMLDDNAPITTKVMHPLPRLAELEAAIDTNFRQAYFAQARNGLFMRMAILTILFAKVPTLLHAVPSIKC
eukprot:Selendium_serpulae@DN6426_c3_g2_i5.p1